MDSREQTRTERRGGLLSRLRPGAEEGQAPDGLEPVLRTLRSYNAKADTKEIERAYRFAEDHHAGQKRLSGEDFIEHPLSVAQILAELGLDTTTLTAALLHDVVEDTEVTLEELEVDFGSDVARIVDGLTKLQAITFKSRQPEQAENVRKMLVAMAGDIRVLLIKLADRLHNMRTLSALPQTKQRENAIETLEIYGPLAHRLGVQQLKWELEDLSFKTLYPGPYREIASLVERRRDDRQRYVETVLSAARARLKDAGVKAEVEGRPKHLYSIYEKMVLGGKEF
ncbi:MAG TPA: HD domain-containing protein, partial [Actinomycetota bacterium]|nr:HD domain-containing protein [Actinomycetota bacterium]